MKRITSLIAFSFFVLFSLMAKSNKVLPYDIVGAGSAKEGMALVKVYVYGKKISDEDLKIAAVHGVVFKGYAGGNTSGARQPAMAAAHLESENKEFCDSFFDKNGECQTYATIINGSYDCVKTMKGYKYGAILQIDKVSLRKTLERAGVVRGLSSGF